MLYENSQVVEMAPSLFLFDDFDYESVYDKVAE